MTQSQQPAKRRRISRPYPTHTLENAMGVAMAIQHHNAGLPFDRELLAGALGTTPRSSAFTMRLNSAAAYGLTVGGYNDADIALTALGRAAAGGGEGERDRAVGQAAIAPDIFGRFYELLDGKRLPEDAYAEGLLSRQLGVHADLTGECLGIIVDNGVFAGIVTDADGGREVRLGGLRSQPAGDAGEPSGTDAVARGGDAGVADDVSAHIRNDARAGGGAGTAQGGAGAAQGGAGLGAALGAASAGDGAGASAGDDAAGKVFVGHIGASEAAEFVASMLAGFGVRCAVADAGVGSDAPLPPDAAAAMKSARAAILVFDGDGQTGAGRDRMMCLLGAAAVLFGDRVVAFHEAGVDAGQGFAGLRRVGFAAGRAPESGLALLGGLSEAGVISVRA